MTARLSAVVDGPDDAPVLVLGPSLGTDTGLFDPQVGEFARSHRVIRYDLRRHGGSEVVRARSSSSPESPHLPDATHPGAVNTAPRDHLGG